MAANNPNNVNAKTIQGPDPTGNQGYPVAVVPATGSDPFPIGPFTDTFGVDSLTFDGDTIEVNTEGMATLGIQLSGAFATGRVSFYTSNDGFVTQRPKPFYNQDFAAGGFFRYVPSYHASGNFIYISTAGVKAVRITADGGFAGALTVNWRLSPHSGVVDIADSPTPSISQFPIGDGKSDSPSQHSDIEFLNPVEVVTRGMFFNGASWDRGRTPNTFRTAGATAAGNTPIWTPAVGNRFRLMRYMVAVTGNAAQAAGGTLTVSLFDGAAGITNQVHSVFVPGAALNTTNLYSSDWVDMGNGFPSVAINNILNVNLSAALTSGVVRVIVCGTEEA